LSDLSLLQVAGPDGKAPIHYAIRSPDTELLQLLLEAGANTERTVRKMVYLNGLLDEEASDPLQHTLSDDSDSETEDVDEEHTGRRMLLARNRST
jgi:ankyrin repeat protein